MSVVPRLKEVNIYSLIRNLVKQISARVILVEKRSIFASKLERGKSLATYIVLVIRCLNLILEGEGAFCYW